MSITIRHAHPWNVAPAEALVIQEQLRQFVVRHDGIDNVCAVAGLDIGLRGDVARAAAVVLSYPELETVEERTVERPIEFPYVPGLLTFREGPAALAVLDSLQSDWDVLLCDGQGIAHPRRLGLASHLGVLIDRPTVGCAKSRLVGRHGALGEAKGSRAELVDGDEVIGAVVRTRAGVKPLYVSVGHRIDLESAVELVLACAPQYRLPEPTRRAHLLASVR